MVSIEYIDLDLYNKVGRGMSRYIHGYQIHTLRDMTSDSLYEFVEIIRYGCTACMVRTYSPWGTPYGNVETNIDQSHGSEFPDCLNIRRMHHDACVRVLRIFNLDQPFRTSYSESDILLLM